MSSSAPLTSTAAVLASIAFLTLPSTAGAFDWFKASLPEREFDYLQKDQGRHRNLNWWTIAI